MKSNNIKKDKNNKSVPEINFYKIIFHKHNKIPIGHFSRNLISKIKDKEGEIINYKEKNEDYFNPISDGHTIKIQKIYEKFQTIKSARKFNHSSINKKGNNLFRPLSQCTTKLGLSKNNSTPYIKYTPKTRPMSQLNKNSTIQLDNFSSNNYSKIKKYTNNIKMKNFQKISKTPQKKNKIVRSSSALLFKQKNNLLNDISNSPMKNLLEQEEEMKKKKKILKARLLTALSRHIVINKDTYIYYNYLFKDELTPEEQKLKELFQKKIIPKKIFYFIKHHPEIFSKFKPPFRYEDYYYSPLEFLKKYFTKEDLIILISSPEYFGLDHIPFKNSDFAFNPTLLSKLEYEENFGNYNKLINKEYKFNPNKITKYDLNKELNKIKKIFKERKIKKVKRKSIKGKDFVSHYERDIEPDEGTVQYFERKYIKYMNNKQKRMEKKINMMKYKKSQFEFLKNERTQILEEEKNIQRITGPIINVIKKNYLKSNNNI
jgi:hypothetical protein